MSNTTTEKTALQRLQDANPNTKVYEAECLNKAGKEISIYIKQPSRKATTEYITLSSSNMHRAEQKILAECLLSNKDEVAQDDTLWGSVMDAITQIIPESRARIKNV